MEHILDINDRAFLAIKEERKRVEIRANTNFSDIDYSNFKVNDTIQFYNSNNEILRCEITKINWYKDVENLLQKEGTLYTLSSTNDYKLGLKSIYSLTGYRESIPKNGVYAIHIKLIKN